MTLFCFRLMLLKEPKFQMPECISVSHRPHGRMNHRFSQTFRGQTRVKSALSRAQIATLHVPTALSVSCRYKDEKVAESSRSSFTRFSLSVPFRDPAFRVLPTVLLCIHPPPLGGFGDGLMGFSKVKPARELLVSSPWYNHIQMRM